MLLVQINVWITHSIQLWIKCRFDIIGVNMVPEVAGKNELKRGLTEEMHTLSFKVLRKRNCSRVRLRKGQGTLENPPSSPCGLGQEPVGITEV